MPPPGLALGCLVSALPCGLCSSFCLGDEPAGSGGECAPGLRVPGQCTTGCGRHEGLVGAGLWVTAGACPASDLLRVRQEVAAAAVRSPSGLEAHLPSSTAGQRRKQGLAQHRDGTAPAGAPSFSERYRGACISERSLHSLCLFRGYRAAVGRPVSPGFCTRGPQPAPPLGRCTAAGS